MYFEHNLKTRMIQRLAGITFHSDLDSVKLQYSNLIKSNDDEITSLKQSKHRDQQAVNDVSYQQYMNRYQQSMNTSFDL